MTTKPSAPPAWATWLLRSCCVRTQLEELEGDLLELFHARSARRDVAYARRCYVVDVLELCLRRCASSTAHGLRAGFVLRALRSYPLRVLVVCMSASVLASIVLPTERLGADVLRIALALLAMVVEISVYTRAATQIARDLWQLRRRGRRPS